MDMVQDPPSSNRCIVTLFSRVLFVYLEQLTKHISSKAKNKSGGYRLNPNRTAAAWATSTKVVLSKWNLCGITYHIGN
jgi:hypothetical protein